MFAFKIVTTVFIALLVTLLGFIFGKYEDKASRYVALGIALIEVASVVAIWG